MLGSQAEDGLHYSSPTISYTIHAKTIYDGLGRAVKASNPYRSTGTATTDGWTRVAYDLAGRVIEVATFTGDSNSPPPDYPSTTNTTGLVTTTYNSEVTTVRDQANKQRRSTLDALGRLTVIEEMNEYPATSVYATTNYGYDARGNLLTVTQAQGATTQTRRFAYDLLSRLLFAANPEQDTSSNALFTYNGQQWAVRYVYDAASNLTDKTDTRPVGNSFVNIHYDYDALNRVTQRSYNDGTPQVNYVYDTASNGVGRLRSVTASGVSASNYTAYDKLGRPTAYNQATEGQTYLMENTYNKAGLVTSEKYPSQKVMLMEYDAAGRAAGVKKQGASFYYAGATATDATNRVQYTAHGAMSVMKLGNNLWEHTTFNSRLQPVQIGLGVNQTSSSVLGLDYTYGVVVGGTLDATKNNGNPQSQTISVAGTTIKQSYVYDVVNRLTSADEWVNAEATPRWTQSYSYDRWGNRTGLTNTGAEGGLLPTQSTPAVDGASNRLAGLSYDAVGNLLSPGGRASYVYDAENRIASFESLQPASYSYDGEGRRVKRVVKGALQINISYVEVYDAGGQLIAEYNNQGAGFGGQTTARYLTADHLGSTRVVTKADGSVKGRYDYLPFGEELGIGISGRSSAMLYGSTDATRQKFTGKERDSESGLDYFGARYYSSVQGRFTSADPENAGADPSDSQSWNGYAYSRNSPLKYIDPEGLKYKLIDLNGNSIDDYSDDDFNKNFRRNKNVMLKDGNIYQNGELIGHYERLSFDDFGPLGQGVFNQLSASRNASYKLIGGFAVVTYAAGAAIGAGAFYAPVVVEVTRRGVDALTKSQCFVAGTEVLTSNGRKAIENLAVGDLILAFDPLDCQSKQASPQKISKIFVRVAPVVVDIKVGTTVIVCTPEHPFWVPGKGWVQAKALKQGSLLFTQAGQTVTVDSVEWRQGSFSVYNIEVDNLHTYYVSALGILVHNQCGPNLTGKIGKIASKLGRSEREIRDAVHAVKRNMPRGGPVRNPDVVVDIVTGEVYPKISGGGLGDSIGNIFDYLK